MLEREFPARVKGVYDGDTILVDIDQGFYDWKHDQKVRLYGLQCPEVRGGTTEQKEHGLRVRNQVRQLLHITQDDTKWGRPVDGDPCEIILRTLRVPSTYGGERRGKYGRWLGTVITLLHTWTPVHLVNCKMDGIDGVDINHLLRDRYPCPASWL